MNNIEEQPVSPADLPSQPEQEYALFDTSRRSKQPTSSIDPINGEAVGGKEEEKKEESMLYESVVKTGDPQPGKQAEIQVEQRGKR